MYSFYRKSNRGHRICPLAVQRLSTFQRMGEDFISLYNRTYRDKVFWPTSFRGSPDSALQEIYSRDINIIFGFFDSKIARKVLCRAKSLFADLRLVSADHAWILPAYYNPNWWRLPAGMDSECSDEDMRAILESLIFIDTVKYPPMDLSLDEFYNVLVSKALGLFPSGSLTEEDLKPYLLRSRATNAHDAVTLLAQSVGVAFDRAGGGKCNNVNVIQTAFEKTFMECEYCRLNSGCFLNQSETMKCQDFCGSEYTANVHQKSTMAYPNRGLRSDHLLNLYGQVSYSQFIDGEHCLVGLLWNGSGIHDEPGNIMGHIYTLEEDFVQTSCVLQLNILRTLRNFIGNSTHCPMAFQWKGLLDPPRSRHLLVYEVPLYQMIIIGMLTGIGFVLAITFLVFNIVWRKNKAVKATSPWLNVVLIVGIVLRLPVPLMDGLIQSAASDKYVELMHPVICYFSELNNYFGNAIFISVLIMKNWRLYRIFNNKEMKLISKGLTDRWLLLGISLWSLPVVLTLIIRFSLTLRLEMIQSLNERLQFEKYGSCIVDSDDVRVTPGTKGFLDIYNTILSFILLGLSILTSLIHSPTIFHREAILSLRAVIVALVPVSSLDIVTVFLNMYVKLTNLESILWIAFVTKVCLPILIMLILFGPSVFVVVKQYKKVKKGRQSRELLDRYRQLLREKEELKAQLSKISEMKSNLLAERQKQSETSSHLGDRRTFKSKTDIVGIPMERNNK